MASICNGGGGSTAIIIENLNWIISINIFLKIIKSKIIDILVSL